MNNTSSGSPKVESNKSIFPSFSRTLMDHYLKPNGITDGGIFQRITCLSRTIYSDLENKENYVPEERIVYTICIAIGLSLGETSELLSLAGMSIYPVNANDSYRELLVKFIVDDKKRNIAQCNEELKKHGFDSKKYLLGTLTKDCELSVFK